MAEVDPKRPIQGTVASMVWDENARDPLTGVTGTLRLPTQKEITEQLRSPRRFVVQQPAPSSVGRDQQVAGLAATDRFLRSLGFQTDGYGNAIGHQRERVILIEAEQPDPEQVRRAQEQSRRFWSSQGYECDAQGAPIGRLQGVAP